MLLLHPRQDIVGRPVKDALDTQDATAGKVPNADVYSWQSASDRTTEQEPDIPFCRETHQFIVGQDEGPLVGRNHVLTHGKCPADASQARLPILEIGWRSIDQHVGLDCIDHLQRRHAWVTDERVGGDAYPS